MNTVSSTTTKLTPNSISSAVTTNIESTSTTKRKSFQFLQFTVHRNNTILLQYKNKSIHQKDLLSDCFVNDVDSFGNDIDIQTGISSAAARRPCCSAVRCGLRNTRKVLRGPCGPQLGRLGLNWPFCRPQDRPTT